MLESKEITELVWKFVVNHLGFGTKHCISLDQTFFCFRFIFFE